MKHLRILIPLAILTACTDQSPTSIQSRGTSVSADAAPVVVDPTGGRAAIDDAVDRIAPALSDPAHARQLVGALRGLRAALDAGRVADGPALANLARVELEHYAQIQPADAPELDAVGLALAMVVGPK